MPKKKERDANSKAVYGGEGETGRSNMQTRRGLVFRSIERRLHLWPQQHSLQTEVEAT